MKRLVIYTVIVGNYDSIMQPAIIDDRFDYVLFTDKKHSEKIGVWQVRSFDYKNDDKTRLSRYPKMHPNVLLSEYEASLYLDANVQIIGCRIYDRVLALYEDRIDWGGIQHPFRDCIYDEAYVCYGKEKESKIMRWCHYLRKENYPRHHGLYENNVIFRMHNSTVRQIDDEWWILYEQSVCRDQLILGFVFWNNPEIKKSLLLPLGESVWKSDTVKRYEHVLPIAGGHCRHTFGEHLRCRCRVGIQEKEAQFKEFHYWLYGLNPALALVLLYFWGVCATIIYGPIIKYRAHKKHIYGR